MHCENDLALHQFFSLVALWEAEVATREKNWCSARSFSNAHFVEVVQSPKASLWKRVLCKHSITVRAICSWRCPRTATPSTHDGVQCPGFFEVPAEGFACSKSPSRVRDERRCYKEFMRIVRFQKGVMSLICLIFDCLRLESKHQKNMLVTLPVSLGHQGDENQSDGCPDYLAALKDSMKTPRWGKK